MAYSQRTFDLMADIGAGYQRNAVNDSIVHKSVDTVGRDYLTNLHQVHRDAESENARKVAEARREYEVAMQKVRDLMAK